MKSSATWFLFVSLFNILHMASKSSLYKESCMQCARHLIKLLCTFSGAFAYVWTWTLSCIEKPVQAVGVSKLGFISYDYEHIYSLVLLIIVLKNVEKF